MLLHTLALALTIAAPGPKDVLAELAKLEGNWNAVAVDEDGKTRKIENGAKLAIKGRRCTITKRNGEKLELVLDIVDLQARALDLRDTEGRLAFRCLYRIDGDTFTLAIGDDDRPKDMTGTKTVSVAIYKRAK